MGYSAFRARTFDLVAGRVVLVILVVRWLF
jgi:hypothetical protein